MNDITCNPSSEQSEEGMFIHVTPDELYKYPQLFGGGNASSKSGDENVSVISQKQETTMDKTELIRLDDMNPKDKLAAILGTDRIDPISIKNTGFHKVYGCAHLDRSVIIAFSRHAKEFRQDLTPVLTLKFKVVDRKDSCNVTESLDPTVFFP